MGNFKPLTAHKIEPSRNRRRRSVLKGSVGKHGDNFPSDLRLIKQALAETGILRAPASQEDVKDTICHTIRHIQRASDQALSITSDPVTLSPASDTEQAMRRAVAEYRFPLSHRAVVLSKSPQGARAILEAGVSIAKRRLDLMPHSDDKPSVLQRAILPSLSPYAYQSNRRLAETNAQTGIMSLDNLISESIVRNGKLGFVEVRDFFNVLRVLQPDLAKALGQNVKRRLRGKPRRRFIKLLRDVPPNEDDFMDGPS